MKAIKGPGFAFLLFGLSPITSQCQVDTRDYSFHGWKRLRELCFLIVDTPRLKGLMTTIFTPVERISSVLFEWKVTIPEYFLVKTLESGICFLGPLPFYEDSWVHQEDKCAVELRFLNTFRCF